jgi:hypothetical protein
MSTSIAAQTKRPAPKAAYIQPIPRSTRLKFIRWRQRVSFRRTGAGQRRYTIEIREVGVERAAYKFTVGGGRKARKLHESLTEELATMTVEQFLAKHDLQPQAGTLATEA